MVTWTKAAQGAIIVVLLLYCFLEAQHYQCFLHWKNIPDHQMPTPATYQGVGEIYSLEDGTCTDDMNRGVLKVILHEVCAAKE